MTTRFGCSMCPKEVKGIFAFLYYAGIGTKPHLLDIQNDVYLPNAILCRKHIEYLPEENFLSEPSSGLNFALQQADGFPSKEGFVINSLLDPCFMTYDNAKKLFLPAVQHIEAQIKAHEESTSLDLKLVS